METPTTRIYYATLFVIGLFLLLLYVNQEHTCDEYQTCHLDILALNARIEALETIIAEKKNLKCFPRI